MSLNGDTGPSDANLQKLLSQLKHMAKEAKRKVAHRRGRVFAGSSAPKFPRALCDVCGKPWDFAALNVPGVPEVRRCSDCKSELADGWTALIRKQEPGKDWLLLWVRGGAWKPGEIIKDVSDEVMKQVQARMTT